METTSVPRIMIAGTLPGVGKSLITTGLVLAFKRRGLGVSVVVTGRPLQQSVIYNRLSRRFVRCLDQSLLTPTQIRAAVGQAGRGADLVLIDGSGGLYDITDAKSDMTDAGIAAAVQAPVILVMDAPRVSRSLAAIVQGYTGFVECPWIQGIIANGLIPFAGAEASRERALCDDTLTTFSLPPCYGCVPATETRYGLPPARSWQESNYTAVPLQFLNDVERLVTNHVDVDAILSAATTAMPFQFDDLVPIVPFRQCRIAIADDSSFGLCFQDNADLLRLLGAEIVPFSPLADSALPPDIGGLYLPGAYLGEYGEAIAANKGLYQSIRDFANAGGVIYSEGAGTAFLCQSFTPEQGGKKYDGVGLIPLHAARVSEEPRSLVGTVLEDSVLAPAGRSVQGYSTGEWSIKRGESASAGVFEVMRFHGPSQEPLQPMLSATAQSCSTLHFLHFGSNPDFARGLVSAAAAHQKTAVGRAPRT
jgi:cobyrinic acid a,c-diamide synthase